MLLVAAGVFAQSLSTIGFITNLIDSAQSFGGSAFFMMLVLAVITILVNRWRPVLVTRRSMLLQN